MSNTNHGTITDELRKWFGRYTMRKDVYDELTAIADRIDAAHKHAIGYVDGRDPETMAENGWVKLPVDADGERIHIGDVMEWCDSGETLTVEGIGSDVLFYIDGENAEWTAARNKRHHHAPTVEDVLREFALACEVVDNAGPDVARIIAQYAAKLQLADDGKEQ